MMNMNTMFGRIHQRTINQNHTILTASPSLMRIRYTIPKPIKSESSIPVKMVNENAVKSSQTMTWGKPTWYFFHTLAEKVRPEEFSNVRQELLDIIYSICVNLPCPDCANHARTYLDKINFNTIQTRDDLKNMLFVFHNTVNQRKGYDIFTIEQLDELYGNANTANIINHFLTTYLKKNSSPRMIANELFRRRIVNKARDWLNSNSNIFMP